MIAVSVVTPTRGAAADLDYSPKALRGPGEDFVLDGSAGFDLAIARAVCDPLLAAGGRTLVARAPVAEELTNQADLEVGAAHGADRRRKRHARRRA